MARAKAYSYVRFSSPEQAQGHSFARQSDLSRQYADENGLELDTELTFEDLGVSAFKGRNAAEGAALADFITAVEIGRIAPGSYLLVESLDRLSRMEPTEAFMQFSRILQKGVNVVTLQDRKLYTKAGLAESFADLLVSLSVMFRAHEESATKSKRLKAAWGAKRSQAAESGKKLSAVSPAWLRLSADRSAFEVIEERAEVVQRIFQMTLDGIGKARIASTLNEENVPTFGRSSGWHPSYIDKILTSEAVLGTYQPKRMETGHDRPTRVDDGPVLSNYFPAIIERADFIAAKAAREGRRIGSGKKGERFSNLFTGFARCGVCGGPLHFINKGENEHYLACSNVRRKHGPCRAPSWQYRAVEAFVLLTLREVDYRELFPAVASSLTESLRLVTVTQAAREGELEKVSAQLDNLLDALASAPHSRALIDRLALLEARKAELGAEVAELARRLTEEQDKAARLERDNGAISDALQEFARVQREGETAKVFRFRSRLHQLLKRTLGGMTLSPSDDPEWHGEIRITFARAASYVRLVRVMAGQKAGYGVKLVDGHEDALAAKHIDVREEERVFFRRS
jgi:DNA invertase Pin-like site-specific DNA recombinase